MLNVGSLFTGIGGFDLGLQRAGMHIAWQCENDPYCRRILRRHWPRIPCYPSIAAVDARASAVDVLPGGFPCQPVSHAGRRLAQADDRWLWPEFARVVGELRPRYVIVENVPGLLGRGLGDVLGDLAALGYDAEWDCLPASAFGAPHRRDRIWIVAYPHGPRLEGHGRSVLRPGEQPAPASRVLGDADPSRRDGRPREFGPRWRREPTDSGWWLVEPDVGRVAHGIPHRVDRLRALGNALVPQIAEWIGRRIIEYEQSRF